MPIETKMTVDEYDLYSAINHADDDWTPEATEVLNRIKAKAWDEGWRDCAQVGPADAVIGDNPYRP